MIALQSGEAAEAIPHYQAALKANPGRLRSLIVLAKVYSSHPDSAIRNAGEALALASRACELTRNNHPDALDALAAAHAEGGNFQEAIKAAQRAIGLARKRGAERIAGAINRRLRLYEAGKPFRQAAAAPPR